MSMRETMMTAMKDAMRSGDKVRLSTIRLMNAALKDKDIEARGLGKGEATDDEILALLQKMVKQRQESLAIYEQAGRTDLAEQERAEVAVISSFLPKQMDEAEMTAAIAAVVESTGAQGMKDMGKVVSALKAKYAGQMDFSKASAMVKARLSA
jgi:uncharacterized protein YqeY